MIFHGRLIYIEICSPLQMSDSKGVKLSIDVPVNRFYNLHLVFDELTRVSNQIVVFSEMVWENTDAHNSIGVFTDINEAVKAISTWIDEYNVFPEEDNTDYQKGDIDISLTYTDGGSYLNYEWRGDKPKNGSFLLRNISEADFRTLAGAVSKQYAYLKPAFQKDDIGLFIDREEFTITEYLSKAAVNKNGPLTIFVGYPSIIDSKAVEDTSRELLALYNRFNSKDKIDITAVKSGNPLTLTVSGSKSSIQKYINSLNSWRVGDIQLQAMLPAWQGDVVQSDVKSVISRANGKPQADLKSAMPKINVGDIVGISGTDWKAPVIRVETGPVITVQKADKTYTIKPVVETPGMWLFRETGGQYIIEIIPKG